MRHHRHMDSGEGTALEERQLPASGLLGRRSDHAHREADVVGDARGGCARPGRERGDHVVPARVPDSREGVVLGAERHVQRPRTASRDHCRRQVADATADVEAGVGEPLRQPYRRPVLLERQLGRGVDAMAERYELTTRGLEALLGCRLRLHRADAARRESSGSSGRVDFRRTTCTDCDSGPGPRMASRELDLVLDVLRSRTRSDGLSVHELRSRLEDFAATIPVPEGARCVEVVAGAVRAEWVAPSGPTDLATLLYLHGGSYVLGSIATHRALVARLAETCGATALLIDYRLAPEYPFPAALDDALDAYRWLLAQGAAPDRIVVAGDSAGGGLAAATLVALRDAGDPLPTAAVLLSPWVDLEGTGMSLVRNAGADPMIDRDGLLRAAAAYLGGADPRTPLAAPLHADLAGLPPMLIQVGGHEALLDDAVGFAARARAAGVDVRLEQWDEMIHVWQAFAPLLPEAGAALHQIGQFVRARLRNGRVNRPRPGRTTDGAGSRVRGRATADPSAPAPTASGAGGRAASGPRR